MFNWHTDMRFYVENKRAGKDMEISLHLGVFNWVSWKSRKKEAKLEATINKFRHMNFIELCLFSWVIAHSTRTRINFFFFFFTNLHFLIG